MSRHSNRSARNPVALLVALASGVALLASPVAARPSGPSGFVPFTIGEDGLIAVRVSVNGAGPFGFLLDTGSNRSAVSPRLAAQLHLGPVAKTTLVTLSHERAGDAARIETLAIGNLTVHDVTAPLLTDGELDALGAGLDGVIGQDVLISHNYTLDYRRSRLTWDEDVTSDADGIRLTLKRDEGRWLVALPQRDANDQVVWFVPDSGAAAFVVFDRGTAPPLALLPLPVTAQTTTVLGAGQARGAILERLRVGPMLFDHRPVLVVDRRGPDAPAGDGLLPLCAFARVSFHARGQYLVVHAR
jgi:predicted aspartyl protease